MGLFRITMASQTLPSLVRGISHAAGLFDTSMYTSTQPPVLCRLELATVGQVSTTRPPPKPQRLGKAKTSVEMQPFPLQEHHVQNDTPLPKSSKPGL